MTLFNDAMESLSYTLPQDALENVQAELSRLGIEAQRVGDTHWSAELTVFGEAYARIQVTDLRAFFAEGASAKTNYKKFGTFQTEVQENEENPRRLPVVTVVVVPTGWWAAPENGAFGQTLELDSRYARKVLCPLEELGNWLANPFTFWTPRAEATPRYWVAPESPNDFGKTPTPAVPSVELRSFATQPLCDEVAQEPEADRVRELAGRLLRHILGASYQVTWDGDVGYLGRQGDSRGLPLAWCSSGEQRVMAFCLFLALQHARRDPQLCLGITSALNGLDSMRRYNAMACLRDFVVATGASVVYKSDVGENRTMADRTLERAVKLAKAAPSAA